MLARALPPGISHGRGRYLLGGGWLGHALHPLLTDFPLGTWMSASLLDLFGGEQSAPAAEKLLLFGLAAAVPTVASGLSDWHEADHAERRVGVVHAAVNTTAFALYGAYLIARRHKRDVGIALGVVGRHDGHGGRLFRWPSFDGARHRAQGNGLSRGSQEIHHPRRPERVTGG